MQIVHHGLFWGSQELIRGPFGRKVRRLMQADLNLYAAHLSLDAHPDVGNNAELARMLELTVDSWFCNVKGNDIGVIVQAPANCLECAGRHDQGRLGVEPRVLAHGPALCGGWRLSPAVASITPGRRPPWARTPS